MIQNTSQRILSSARHSEIDDAKLIIKILSGAALAISTLILVLILAIAHTLINIV